MFLDCESNILTDATGKQSHTFKLGWAAHWFRGRSKRPESVKWRKLNEPRDWWDFVDDCVEPKHTTVAFAHNLPFDLVMTGGFPALVKRGWSIKMLYYANGVTIIQCKREKVKLLLLDTLNFYKAALREIGDTIGLHKGDVDFDTVSIDELSDYCKNDVNIILRLMQGYVAFILKNELGNFSMTISGQAFRAYRHRFMGCEINIHDNERATALERRAYYGGRSEAFRVGDMTGGPYHQVDINSMYPFIMRKFSFPYKLRGILGHTPLSGMRRGIKHEQCIAVCQVTTDEPVYPYRHRGRLLFPVGTFRTTLSTPEVAYALEHGHLDRVETCCLYKRGILFRRWVDEMYKLRQAAKSSGNKLEETMVKLLMNSLYGKFGQRSETWTEIDIEPDMPDGVYEYYDRAIGRMGKMRFICGTTWELTEVGEASESFPAIAAHVTAFSRMYLWELIGKAGRENVFYMDTDSLIVNDEGLTRLRPYLNPSKLGMLKLEMSADELVIYGPKDYRHGEKVRTKGIRKTAVEIAPNTYRQQQWASLAGVIEQGMTDTYFVKDVVKRLKRVYRKGVVTPQGYVEPFRLSLDEDPDVILPSS